MIPAFNSLSILNLEYFIKKEFVLAKKITLAVFVDCCIILFCKFFYYVKLIIYFFAETFFMSYYLVSRLLKYFIIIDIFLLILFCTGCSSLRYESVYKNKGKSGIIENLVLQHANKYNYKGFSISVVHGNEVYLKNGYGYGSLKVKAPVDENTVFPIASVSKVFTAILILKLQEEGKLKLDDPINKFLKEFDPKTRIKPTIRDLLTHRAGIPSDYFSGFTIQDSDPDPENGFRDLSKILHETQSTYEPKTASSYSNFGFSLLGLIIERASGKTLDNYAKDKIFTPLGMTRTSYLYNCKTNCSNGFFTFGEVKSPKIRDLGAGSISSSINDLTIFSRMLLNDGNIGNVNIIKPTSLKEMFSIQNSDSLYDGEFKIGLPFWILGSTEQPYHTHGGDLPPFHTYLLLDLKNKISITITTNTISSSILLGDLALEIQKNIIVNKQEHKDYNQNRVLLSEFKGSYISPSQILKFQPYKDYISTNIPLLNLKKNDLNSYNPFLKLFGFIKIQPDEIKKIEFIGQISNSKLPYITLKYNNIHLQSFVPTSTYPISKTWKDKIGKYTVMDRGRKEEITNVKLSIEDNLLVLEGKFEIGDLVTPLRFFLKPISENKAVIQGVGRNAGDILIFEENIEGDYLKFSGFIFKKNRRLLF